MLMLTFKASLWRLGGQKFKHQIFLKFLRYGLCTVVLYRKNPHIFLMKFGFYIFYINLVLQKRSIHPHNALITNFN